MPHAIQIRQTGGPEVLNWTPIRRLARELKQQDSCSLPAGEFKNAPLRPAFGVTSSPNRLS